MRVNRGESRWYSVASESPRSSRSRPWWRVQRRPRPTDGILAPEFPISSISKTSASGSNSFDYFLIDPGTFWNLNADLKYRLPDASVRWLYLGGGLNIARVSGPGNDRTRAGVNFLAGVESLSGRVHPFGEFRFTANDGSTGQLAVGLNFTLSNH
jgi:hypothetical protein